MKYRKPIICITLLLVIFLLFQFTALIRCEILTIQYYTDFEFAYQSNTMLGEMERFKVLRCDGQTAEVYYIEESYTRAHVLTFQKAGELWEETGWNCIWSTTGSASEVIWPYWWHFIYGGF